MYELGPEPFALRPASLQTDTLPAIAAIEKDLNA
jgi:hypothetical protein